MTRIRDIQRTAAFAWSPDTAPFIATGTQAGAVAADFSDNTQLELWDLDLENAHVGGELAPVASVTADSRFYDIAWGKVSNDKPRGIIAGALENGSLDLWSVDAFDPLVSRATKHTGSIKSLQFNPFKSELLATAGAKGELYVWDLNNTENPFLLGNRAARADDFDCLDWNKKVPHILVTGGNGGFVTVWDVKSKKESLTLNNLGRKAVSAVAWHPEQQTKLITATPDDTNPVILLWDLRNSNAPERTLSGHELGVLSLSWCKQDTDLLLSCGKDNRTICWNPQTGEKLGEFPVVANWTFKTQWNPRNPSLSATASFDGKIVVQTLQNTNPTSSQVDNPGATLLDADDFFSRASNAQTSSFTLKQPPKWLRTPVGASFGFAGKLVSFTSPEPQAGQPRRSAVKISTFAVDSGVSSATKNFEKALREGNLVSVCDLRRQDAKTDEEKADWKILRTLFEANPREKLIEYLGFKEEDLEDTDAGMDTRNTNGEGENQSLDQSDGPAVKDKRLSSFFADTGADSENFLADLSSIQSTRGAKANNPFQIFTGNESGADRKITRAVVLGQFEKAVDVCLKEDRISDAFMLAICGGEKCIEKVKAAYFTKNAKGPNYLRVLASIVGKNLWDVVHNAGLANWKEVMVALCSFADGKDFPDLCEALGDRLEQELGLIEGRKEARKHASFCYLAGSKLEKVVDIWIEELHEDEKAGLEETSDDSTFAVHARSLQNLIEKVTVFREAVKFSDQEKSLSSGWKLHVLYEKYCEYADVAASHGQLEVAERYLDLLPTNYPAATVARNRVKEASGKGATITQARKPQKPAVTGYGAQQHQAASSPYQPQQSATATTGPANPYAPPAPMAAPANPYGAPTTAPQPGSYAPPTLPTGANPYAPPAVTQGYKPSLYQPAQPTQVSGQYGTGYPGYNASGFGQPPPQRNFSPTASVPPPSQASNMVNWNDTPNVTKMPRRATPSATAPVTSPFPGAPSAPSPPTTSMPFGAPPPRGSSVPPPPKNAAPPQRVQSPAQHQLRSQSPVAQAQVPYALAAQTFHPSQLSYASAPPPTAAASRYTPAPAPAAAAAAPQPRQNQTLPPPPQGAFVGVRQGGPGPQYAHPPTAFSQPPTPAPYAPAPSQNQGSQYGAAPGPSQYGPPPTQRPPSQPAQLETAPPPKAQTPVPPPSKHPAGDRTHIPSQYRPIFELLTSDFERVKQRAPPAFQRQVKDTEKRLNILYDHINNKDVLSQEALESMLELSKALVAKDYATAHSIQVDLVTNRTSECNIWMPGVKRLIEMSRATPE
ncbi:hypothetical protein C7212DRAFT_277515 [Tuber magnatum]|uniref:Protein transport protein SEC31 n=1 Tax=Tuber magnatum TaxID=42249 RepID=A0A317ST57_9PEZI|nr:hypothetical protein C7212DRAFT_277515 [Tuber magnatum]